MERKVKSFSSFLKEAKVRPQDAQDDDLDMPFPRKRHFDDGDDERMYSNRPSTNRRPKIDASQRDYDYMNDDEDFDYEDDFDNAFSDAYIKSLGKSKSFLKEAKVRPQDTQDDDLYEPMGRRKRYDDEEEDEEINFNRSRSFNPRISSAQNFDDYDLDNDDDDDDYNYDEDDFRGSFDEAYIRTLKRTRGGF